MRKIIVLSISILVTLVGTLLLGLYDFKVWLAPDGKNATTISTEYRSYVVEEFVDFANNETPLENTKSKIELARLLSNYKYREDPIYHKETEYFKMDIYQNQFWYVNSSYEQEFGHYRYEIFIYDVNYELLRERFGEQSVPGKSTVDSSDYPYLIINFYPNEEYDNSEALISPKVDSSGNEIDGTIPIKLYNDEKLIGSKLSSSASISLFDYSSNPTKQKDGEVFRVNFLALYDYSTIVGGDETYYNDNRDLFADGGYVKVDAVLTVDDKGTKFNYTLSDSIVKEKIDGFTLDSNKISDIEFKEGFLTSSNAGDTIKNIRIDGVKTFNSWIVGKYLWWHCLIAFAVLGLIMTGFYFIFTYEEKGNIKKKTVKRKKK